MALSINTIKPAPRSKSKRKRIGRGNASGTGTYSGKGLKGQKARSGVSNLKRLGMKQVLLRTPKTRGFRSLNEKDLVVNISGINKNFSDNDLINPKSLRKKGLISQSGLAVKILGMGELKLKGLRFSDVKMSESVKEQIKKNSGQIIETGKQNKEKGKKKAKK